LFDKKYGKRHIISRIVSWCCMCKEDRESIDHMFLHCKVARELWDTVLNLFGMNWVMPRRVVDLLTCWQGKLGRHRHIEIWKAVPHCLMWCHWKERETHVFFRIVNGCFGIEAAIFSYFV
jgi:hypothetical protein